LSSGPRSSLPAEVLTSLAGRLAHLLPPRPPGVGGNPPLAWCAWTPSPRSCWTDCPTNDAAKAQDFEPFLYVLDLLLPVASLGVRTGWTPTGVAQWLVVVWTLAGWLLGLTLVAAISGAFKRD
jgi:hypothetical protein